MIFVVYEHTDFMHLSVPVVPLVRRSRYLIVMPRIRARNLHGDEKINK